MWARRKKECDKTCETCIWFVEETNIIGDWQHSEAVKQGKGFCLTKDLFTGANAKDKACDAYYGDSYE